ncbi:hypothetical protein MTR67_039872, partial [Solanum verrucosum]
MIWTTIYHLQRASHPTQELWTTGPFTGRGRPHGLNWCSWEWDQNLSSPNVRPRSPPRAVVLMKGRGRVRGPELIDHHPKCGTMIISTVRGSPHEFLLCYIAFFCRIDSGDDIQVDPKKTEAVKNFPRPFSTLDIQILLVLVNYYRWFVEEFSSVVSLLTTLTKKKVIPIGCSLIVLGILFTREPPRCPNIYGRSIGRL